MRVLINLVNRFVATLRGHVGAVYRLAWSADSRLLVSASKDSTLKVCAFRSAAEGHKADVSKDMGPQDLQTQNGSTWPL